MIPRPADVTPGGPPPWSGSDAASRPIALSDVIAALKAHPVRTMAPDPLARKPAAVLVVLHPGPNGVEVVLTRRPWHLRTHPGEIAFPGGGHEPDDATLVATAEREALEEVALSPEATDVIAELGHLATMSSGAEIVPYVAVLGERPELTADPGEVAEILHVPLRDLLENEAWREEIWVRDDEVFVVTFFELVGDTIWGATARVLRELCELVTCPQGPA